MRTLVKCGIIAYAFICTLLQAHLPGALAEEPSGIKVVVSDIDYPEKKIASEIQVVASSTGTKGKTYIYDPQDESPMIHDCAPGEVFRAFPMNDEYYHSKKYNCANTINFKVVSRFIFDTILKDAENAEQEEKISLAILLYSEVIFRAQQSNINISDQYVKKYYELVGSEFGVDQPYVFDSDQGIYVMSRPLKYKVGEFQKAAGLKVTGDLDYATLSERANMNIGDFIRPK